MTVLEIVGLLVAIVTVLITLAKEWQVVSTRCREMTNWLASSLRRLGPSFRPGRRALLIGVAGIAALAIFQLYRRRDHRPADPQTPKFTSEKVPSETELATNSIFVAHKASHVIHHIEICAGHLPSELNRVPVNEFNETYIIHRSKRFKILEYVVQQGADEKAVQLLSAALDQSPTTIHLYDALLRVLGKLKRYEEIHNELNSASQTLTRQLNSHQRGSTSYKHIEKALAQLRLRIQQAQRRADRTAIGVH